MLIALVITAWVAGAYRFARWHGMNPLTLEAVRYQGGMFAKGFATPFIEMLGIKQYVSFKKPDWWTRGHDFFTAGSVFGFLGMLMTWVTIALLFLLTLCLAGA